MFNNYNDLRKELVESGNISKSNEVEFIIPSSNAKFIASMLKLSPGAKIKYHVHTNDSEFYILYNENKDILFCPKGEGHELKNNTDKTLKVLSIKLVDSE